MCIQRRKSIFFHTISVISVVIFVVVTSGGSLLLRDWYFRDLLITVKFYSRKGDYFREGGGYMVIFRTLGYLKFVTLN